MLKNDNFLNLIRNHEYFMVGIIVIIGLLLLLLIRSRNSRKSNLTIKSCWDVFGIKMTNISTQLISAEIINHLESNHSKLRTICLADYTLINKAYSSKSLHYLLNSSDLTIPGGYLTSIAARFNRSRGIHHKSIHKIFIMITNVIVKFSSNTCFVSSNNAQLDNIESTLPIKDRRGNIFTLDISDDSNLSMLRNHIAKNKISTIIALSLEADKLIDIRNISRDSNVKLMVSTGNSNDLIKTKNPFISLLVIVTYFSRLIKYSFSTIIQPRTVDSREFLNPAGLTNSFTYRDVYKESLISKATRKHWHSKILFKFYLKRSFDVLVSALALLLLGPLLLLTALAIRAESSGPIFFKQVRVGYKGKPFTMYKFRSMFVDAEERLASIQKDNESGGGVLFKMKKDPRITRTGRIIRKLSIDELPQIINVLRGDMSIVGPRPALPSEVSQYEIQDRKRLQTKPGLTCLWQIGGRSDLTFEQQIELDVKYLTRKGLAEDIAIVVKTVPAVLTGRGAY